MHAPRHEALRQRLEWHIRRLRVVIDKSQHPETCEYLSYPCLCALSLLLTSPSAPGSCKASGIIRGSCQPVTLAPRCRMPACRRRQDGRLVAAPASSSGMAGSARAWQHRDSWCARRSARSFKHVRWLSSFALAPSANRMLLPGNGLHSRRTEQSGGCATLHCFLLPSQQLTPPPILPKRAAYWCAFCLCDSATNSGSVAHFLPRRRLVVRVRS